MLINGNCEIELKKIESESVDAVITDPPYQYLKHKLDIPFDYELVFDELYRVMKPNSFMIYFGRGIPFYKWNIYNSKKLKFKEEFIWEKEQGTTPLNPIMRVHENIAVFQKGKKKINKVRIDKRGYAILSGNIGRILKDADYVLNLFKKIKNYEDFEKTRNQISFRKKNGYTVSSDVVREGTYKTMQKQYREGIVLKSIIRVKTERNKYQHPTQKPVRLMQILVSLVTNEGETVLDPFMGGGSTGVACKKLNRKFIGIEISKEYYKIAKERINKIQKGIF